MGKSNAGLRPERLKELSQQLQSGLAARKRLDQGRFSEEERDALNQAVEAGHTARGLIVEANIPLVEWVARRYMGQRPDLADLVQEGFFGLIRAVELFNPDKGYQFSTYAIPWIRQAMSRSGGNRFAEMHVPMKTRQEISHVLRTFDELTLELHREPSHEEVAARCHITADRVDELLDLMPHVESIDATIGDDSKSMSVSDTIADPNAQDASELVEQQDLQALIFSLVEGLSEPQRTILSRRFGLIDGKVHTLEEVAADYSVSRAELRQMELRAMLRLRDTSDLDRVRMYLKN
jgi:RNA polymerase sigma factor (sigma-70 family)